jgi:transcriptional antiterminator RfaH
MEMSVQESEQTGEDQAWFCLRSQPKHEHIAAANLRQIEGIEIFNPRLRQRKATRRGAVWVTESLFPNYLFAHFSLGAMLDQVKYTSGVSTVVHFGGRYPAIPDKVIEELQRNFGGIDLSVVNDDFNEGDQVMITGSALSGFQAVVLRTMPCRQRVQVLVELLGRASTVEVSVNSVVIQRRHPQVLSLV